MQIRSLMLPVALAAGLSLSACGPEWPKTYGDHNQCQLQQDGSVTATLDRSDITSFGSTMISADSTAKVTQFPGGAQQFVKKSSASVFGNNMVSGTVVTTVTKAPEGQISASTRVEGSSVGSLMGSLTHGWEVSDEQGAAMLAKAQPGLSICMATRPQLPQAGQAH